MHKLNGSKMSPLTSSRATAGMIKVTEDSFQRMKMEVSKMADNKENKIRVGIEGNSNDSIPHLIRSGQAL